MVRCKLISMSHWGLKTTFCTATLWQKPADASCRMPEAKPLHMQRRGHLSTRIRCRLTQSDSNQRTQAYRCTATYIHKAKRSAMTDYGCRAARTILLSPPTPSVLNIKTISTYQIHMESLVPLAKTRGSARLIMVESKGCIEPHVVVILCKCGLDTIQGRVLVCVCVCFFQPCEQCTSFPAHLGHNHLVIAFWIPFGA